MTINIKGEDVELKFSYRSMLIFERIQEKSFNISTLMDLTVYMYASILAARPDIMLEFNEFLDFVDENPQAIADFSVMITNKMSRDQVLQKMANDNNVEEVKPVKKKRTRK